jgi:hypothetical protein
MPRKKNQVQTVPVTISTTPPVVQYLEALVTTGLYGKTTPEAAERLISQRIEQLIREGTLKPQRREE